MYACYVRYLCKQTNMTKMCPLTAQQLTLYIHSLTTVITSTACYKSESLVMFYKSLVLCVIIELVSMHWRKSHVTHIRVCMYVCMRNILHISHVNRIMLTRYVIQRPKSSLVKGLGLISKDNVRPTCNQRWSNLVSSWDADRTLVDWWANC